MSKEIVKFVRKSNNLVEARYKFDIWETRIFTSMLMMIAKDDEDFKDYKIYLKDIVEAFDLSKSKDAYKFLRQGARKLMKKTFYVPYEIDGQKRLFETPIVSSLDSAIIDNINIRDENLYITVSFHPKMKPFLLQLKTQFTIYDVRNILKLPSVYSIRLYELLKQYEKIGKRTFEVQELKEILGILDKYKLYGHFKKRVLLKAQKDLERFADISFKFSEIKRGRAVSKLVFFIYKNTPGREKNKTKKELDKITISYLDTDTGKELYPLVQKWVSEKSFAQWLTDYPESQIRKGINYTLSQIEKGKTIKNIGGYLLAIIREPMLFDPDEQKKNQKVEQAQKQKDQLQKKQALELEDKELRSALYAEELSLIEQLFAEEATLHQVAIEAAKNRAFSGYNRAMSDEENYENNVMFRSSVINAVKKMFPEKFEPLQKDYIPKIEAVKKILWKL